MPCPSHYNSNDPAPAVRFSGWYGQSLVRVESARELTPPAGPPRAPRGVPQAYQDPMGGRETNFRLGMWQERLFPGRNLPYTLAEAEVKALQGMPPKNYREYVDIPVATISRRAYSPAVTSPLWWR